MDEEEIETINFFVEGNPVTQGSMNSFRGRIVHSHAKSLKDWRRDIAISTQMAMPRKWKPLDDGVELTITFYLDRPKSHFNKKGTLNAEGKRHTYPTRKRKGGGDLDKLVRAVGDAISGESIDGLIVGQAISDDARITDLHIRKRWAEDIDTEPGALITISEMKLLPF